MMLINFKWWKSNVNKRCKELLCTDTSTFHSNRILALCNILRFKITVMIKCYQNDFECMWYLRRLTTQKFHSKLALSKVLLIVFSMHLGSSWDLETIIKTSCYVLNEENIHALALLIGTLTWVHLYFAPENSTVLMHTFSARIVLSVWCSMVWHVMYVCFAHTCCMSL